MNMFNSPAQLGPSNRPPENLQTLVDVCRWQADQRGDQAAFTHLTDDDRSRPSWSFAELDRRLRSIAATLAERGRPGDRVLIVQPPGLDYVASLFGCMYAGMVAVPVYPPDLFRLRQTLPRLQAITSEADARIMLSSREVLGERVGPLWQLCDEAAVATDEIAPSLGDGFRPRAPAADELALLQYTSGSTGTPRGVALTHRNLMANAEQGFYAFDVPDAVCVFWLPPYHDLGLIGGMLIPIFGGRHSVLMSPLAFLQEPIRWFRAITEFRGTTTASPNFGYEWCLRKITLDQCEGIDLSSLRLAAVGAEPVRAGTLARFAQRFAEIGFDAAAFTPGYGMAEATLAVTNKPLGTEPVVRTFARQPLQQTEATAVPCPRPNDGAPADPEEATGDDSSSLQLVSSGQPVRWCEVRIVDPQTRCEVPDGKVGEIWVRSPAVARGYWQREEATAAAFDAQLADAVYPERASQEAELAADLGRDGYLRTGDLGFLLDGELFVSGRLKEQIIIAGRNFFPHDIESAIQNAHEAFKIDGGVAFSIDTDAGEQLVIAQEILRPKRFDLQQLTLSLLHAVMDEFGIVPAEICLVRAASLPKTSSGKLQRLECRRQHADGELQILQHWSSQRDSESVPQAAGLVLRSADLPAGWSPAQRRLAELWCEALDLRSASPQQHFLHAGGHSLSATQLVSRVREELGVKLQLSDLFDHPTLGALAERVQHAAGTAPEAEEPGEPVVIDRAQPLPLSAAQTGFWLLDQLGHDDAFLRLAISLRLHGAVELPRLVDAIRRLPRRHPALSSAVTVDDRGRPRQSWHAGVEIPVETADLREATEQQRTDALRSLRERLVNNAWDLARPPLFRAAVVQLGEDQAELLLSAHHLACDGWSLGLIIQDLARRYSDPAAANDEDIEPAAFQRWAASVVRHSNSRGRGDTDWAEALGYWGQRLSGVPQDSRLGVVPPGDAGARGDADPQQGGGGSAVLRWRLTASEAARLERWSAELGVTSFTLLVTLWHSVLKTYRGSSDLVLGVPVANRFAPGDEETVGCFITTVPFRLDFLAADLDTVDQLRRGVRLTHEAWLSDLRHSIVPLDTIVDLLDVERSSDRLPLVQHLVLHQPHLVRDAQFGEATVVDYQTDYSRLGAYETALLVEQHCDELEIGIVHALSRIDTQIAGHLLGGLVERLSSLIADGADPAHGSERAVPSDGQAIASAAPHALIAPAIPCRVRAELDQWLEGRQLTEPAVDFLQSFAARVAEDTTRIAVTAAGASWSYGQLDTRADAIAERLVQLGVGAESIVAVALPRTPDLLAVLIGVWKAGGAYLPIDLKHPPQRRREILEDARPHCLVVDRAERGTELAGDAHAPPVLVLEESGDTLAAADPAGQMTLPAADRRLLPTQLAYVIYTSGSTGKPKGVAIEHRSVANLLRSFAHQPGFAPGERFLASTTLGFDISVLELFLPLANGGEVVLAPYSISEDADRVLEFLHEHPVDLLQGTPSSLRMLLEIGWQPTAGQRVWCGGEPLHADLAERLLAAEVQLWNVYGPTETTVWSFQSRVSNDQLHPLSIGRPIDGTTALVLDRRGRRVPIGVTGELWIGGAGVAREYHGQPELTQQSFFSREVSWPGEPGRVLGFYRTGDLVRMWPDGRLEFLGRVDRQVKLRGHRVELGEVEAALHGLDGIVAAAARTVEIRGAAPQLVAYYQQHPEAAWNSATLREALSRKLPPAMLPARWVELAKIPCTAAGKIDYRALPVDAEKLTVLASEPGQDHFVPPRNSIEEAIADTWKEVLGVARVSVHDNFFQLGGHSLKAAQVFARLRECFGPRVQLRELYRSPTVAALAEVIEAAGGSEQAARRWLDARVAPDDAAQPARDREGAAGQPRGSVEPADAADAHDTADAHGTKDPNGANQAAVVGLPSAASEVAPCEADAAPAPLSFAEQRLWFVDRLEPSHPFYNLPLAARVNGPLDLETLERALNECVARHETLRSTYHVEQGAPRREIADRLELRLQRVDLSGTSGEAATDGAPSEAPETRLDQLMAAEARRPFQLEHGPLLRVTVYRLAADRHVVLLVMHHIISDGWSMAVMLGELAEIYRAIVTDETPQLPPLALSYAEFAERQRHEFTEQRLAEAEAFWEQTLAGCNETLDLPTDFERPAIQDFEGATLRLQLDEATTAGVKALAERTGTTPFMVLLTAYSVLLARYAGTRDVNVGTAIANRPQADLENLIGFFVGTLVLRTQLRGEPTFEELLEEVRETTIEAFGHAEVPFERLVERLAHSRDRSHSPLFQAAFILQNTPREFRTAPELSIDPILVDNGTAKYDLTLFLWERQQRFEGYFEYRSSLFAEASIARMSDSFQSLLRSALEDPQRQVDALPLVSASEQERILQRAIGPQRDLPEPRLLHRLLDRQVEARGEATALIYRDTEWTFGQLAERVERLARGLQSMAVDRETPTLLYLPRSADQVAAELACAQCGSPFVPLDTNFPLERVAQVAAQTGPRVIVCRATAREEIASLVPAARVVTLEEVLELSDHPWREVEVDPHDPCYLIFTSGSTGKPKGVVIEHHSICNFLEAFADRVELSERDRVAHMLSPSFDGALSETFPALNRGVSVVVTDPEDVRDPQRLTELLNRHGVTFAAVTPPMLAQLDPARLSSLERVLSAGAILTGELAEKWLKSHRLFNGYGPTECTVGTAIEELRPGDYRLAPIGRPLPNMRMYILDEQLRPVPDGVPGEVYLAGACVARGYWDNPQLTDASFLPDPFQPPREDGGQPKMYRTGDLGIWNREGLIEIIGRRDEQIKLRGYRIEPGEIAAAMERLAEVEQATVLALGSEGGGAQRLVAYFVPAESPSNAGDGLRAAVADEHIDSWLALFDQSHQHGGLAVDPEDDFAGWQSVITGEAIDRELMREWAEESARQIRAFQPQRILEVGCGTGLILLRLGEEFTGYTGVDLMPSAIAQLRQTLEQRPALAHRVDLHVGRADQLDSLPLGQYDTIVLNSVVQYFPSPQYLVEVLQSLTRYLLPGGRIFLGDIRDLRLQAAFATEVELHRAGSEAVTAQKFRRRVRSRIEHDEELLVDPRMFDQLGTLLPRLAGSRVTWKRGSMESELNRYRYDVTLHFDQPPERTGLESPYPADERICNAGAPRAPWLLWQCIRAAADDRPIAELVAAVTQLEQESLGCDWDRWAEALRELGCDAALECMPFDAEDVRGWTNQPLQRRRSQQRINTVRDRLRSTLPEYMVPAAFVELDELPKTVQGKLDKAALPPPPAARPEWAGRCRPARDAHESLLVEVWQELLEIDPIGIEDDFFELGGHSMLAVRMVAEVEKRSGVAIPLAALFRRPTIEHLAELLRHPQKSGPAAALIGLNQQTTGTPLFCIHPAGGTVFCYRELADHLQQRRPVYGLQARGVDGRDEPHRCLVEMAGYYADAIRQICPEGPCELLGWSIGGNIAFEVARQLQESGVQIEALNLLDSGLLQESGPLREDDFLPLIAALFPGEEHLPLDQLRQLSREEQLKYFVGRASRAGIVPIDNELLGMQIFSVFQANVKAVHEYQPVPYPGPIRLIRPSHQTRTGELFDDPALGWEPLCSEMQLATVPGDHAGMLRGDAVEALARML